MGSGKSYIGKRLAQELNYSFVDLDDYIVGQSSYSSIPKIFEQQGEAFFRQLEQQALIDSQNWEKVVIATGGGSPCQGKNIQLINESGYSIFLDPPIDILLQRLLQERAKRPLITDLREDELQEFIEELLKKRRPFYSQAKIAINNKTATNIIKGILGFLQ